MHVACEDNERILLRNARWLLPPSSVRHCDGKRGSRVVRLTPIWVRQPDPSGFPNFDTIRPPLFCGGYGALGGPMKIATPTQAAVIGTVGFFVAVWVLL